MGKANHLAKPSLKNGDPKCPQTYGNPREGARQAQLAYVAGFFDGEGTVGIARNRGRKKGQPPYYRPMATITSTDLHVLQLIQQWFSEGRLNVANDKRAKPHYKDAFTLRFEGPRAYRFLTIIKPYLVLKRRQASLAICFYWLEFIKSQHGTHSSGLNNGLPQQVLDRRAKFYWKMRELNGSMHLGRPRTARTD